MKFTGGKDEARFLMTLVRAYQGAQETTHHLGRILDEFKLRKPGTMNLDSDKVVTLAEASTLDAPVQDPESPA